MEPIPKRGIAAEEDTHMTTATYTVTGMTCGHCEMLVREEVEELAGVDGVTVDAGTGTLVVTSTAAIDDELIYAAVTEAGYSAARA